MQIPVQILSTFFEFLQITALRRLFNYAIRLRFRKAPLMLDGVHAWNSVCAGSVAWDLSLK